MKIILDTNFLLVPMQFKVDIFLEIERIVHEKYELYVLDKTVDELNRLALNRNKKVKDRDAAKLAIKIAVAKGVKTIKTTSDKYADDLIVEIADKNTVVATNDIDLRRRVRNKGAKTILMRKKAFLVLSE